MSVTQSTWSLSPSSRSAAPPRGLRRVLGLGFGLAVIVGATLGIGILRTPGLVAGQLSTPSLVLLVWLVSRLYTLLGAVCFAERWEPCCRRRAATTFTRAMRSATP